MLLAAQGLRTPSAAAGKAEVAAAVARMGALQIDTINVLARSHLLVLWSRLGTFDPQWLDELLAEGSIFEYWSHAACFLPIDDFALYRPAMLRYRERSIGDGWLKRNPEIAERVLERIRREGSIRAADFQREEGPVGAWWDRKPEKLALEELYNCGLAMIARRERFQRVYALREQILPDWSDDTLPSWEAIERGFILKSVRALGVTPARWVSDYFRRPKRGVVARLEALADEGALRRVSVPELGAEPWYLHPDHQQTAEAAADGTLGSDCTTLLSPFDPIVWHRERARELFQFEYKIEVYTPAAQRKFGYFTMPILHRGALVGRLCPKAHRKEGVLEVRRLHLEPEAPVTDELAYGLAQALKACAAWNRTPTVEICATAPAEFGDALRSAVNA